MALLTSIPGRPGTSGRASVDHWRDRRREDPNMNGERTSKETSHGDVRLRRGDHRLRVRRKRRRAPRRGEGLPSRGDGVGQAMEGRRHSEVPVAPARASCGSPPPSSTASRGSSTSTTCSSSPAPVSAADRTSTRTRLYVPPKQFFDAPEWASITDWADELAPAHRPGDADARRRSLPLHADRRRSRHAERRDRDGTRGDVQQGAGRRLLRDAQASRPTIRTSAVSVRGAPAASRAASATSAAATTRRTS